MRDIQVKPWCGVMHLLHVLVWLTGEGRPRKTHLRGPEGLPAGIGPSRGGVEEICRCYQAADLDSPREDQILMEYEGCANDATKCCADRQCLTMMAGIEPAYVTIPTGPN